MHALRTVIVGALLLLAATATARANSFLYVALDRATSGGTTVTLLEVQVMPDGFGPWRYLATVPGIRHTELSVSHDGRLVVWAINPPGRPDGPISIVVFDRLTGNASVISGLGLRAGGRLYSDPRALRFFYVVGGIPASISILEPTGVETIFYSTFMSASPLGISPDGVELYLHRANTFPSTGDYHVAAVDPLTGAFLRRVTESQTFPQGFTSVTATRDRQRFYISEHTIGASPGRVTVVDAAGAELASQTFFAPVANVTLDESRHHAYVTQSDRLTVVDMTSLSEIAVGGGHPHVVFDRSQGVAVSVGAHYDQSGACNVLALELWAGGADAKRRLTFDVDGDCAAVAIATPPDAPTNLSQQVVGRRVTLSWSGVLGASDYQVEAGSSSGLANLARFRSGTATELTVDNVPAGTYYVRIRAVNAVDVSASSPEIIVNVP